MQIASLSRSAMRSFLKGKPAQLLYKKASGFVQVGPAAGPDFFGDLLRESGDAMQSPESFMRII